MRNRKETSGKQEIATGLRLRIDKERIKYFSVVFAMKMSGGIIERGIIVLKDKDDIFWLIFI